jgi:hypothetical protein
MTTLAIVPVGYQNNRTDYLNAPGVDRSGAVREVAGTVTVTNGTLADAYVGLVPFQKGAKFILNDKSIHCGNFGAASTTVNVGVVYADSTTDDPDAFASLSTAPQSGGFVTIDEIEGMTLVTPTDGWLAVQLKAANADADAAITYNVLVCYDV